MFVKNDNARARPICTRRISLLLISSFFLLMAAVRAHGKPLRVAARSALQSTAAPKQTENRFDTAGEAQLVELLNQTRIEHGLPPLTVDERLTEAARKHSELMVQHAALSHQFEGEPPLQLRIANEGLPADRVSENVDLNNRSVAEAHEGFLHSPPHLRAILDPDFNAVGVGVVRSGEEIYVTEDFARKLPVYSEPQAEAKVEAAIRQEYNSRVAPATTGDIKAQLRHIACDMALNDSVNAGAAMRLPGVHEVFAWTAGDPAKLPKGIDKALLPEPSGYALGACFAPSVSHPGGVYWLVIVTY